MNPHEKVLKKIAAAMLETAEHKPNFSNDALLDALLIFQTVFTDKVFDCMQEDGSSFDNQCKKIESAGNEIRKLIKVYTNLDIVELVNNYGK